jgi:hypothetical protein
MTSKALEEMKVPYHIVIEPQEYEQYAAVIDPAKILMLPFSNLGQGSIPARNWVWEHAIATGAERHWILDDNILKFWRKNRNLRIVVNSGTIFRCCEDFTDRYENVAISGMNYYMFCPDRQYRPAYYLNTRVYSCILLRNDLPYRWRGRYNEDTDLSLRVLKDGHCTILFNAFLAQKMTTMMLSGGNTEALYKIKEGEKDGRLLMAESLVAQHPDVTTITWRWGRWQHLVYYDGFKRTNKLKRKANWNYENAGVNNYGMEVKKIK